MSKIETLNTEKKDPNVISKDVGARAIREFNPPTAPTRTMEVPPELLRPKRKERLDNGLVQNAGGARLITPDKDLIQDIQAGNPRVHYFGIANTRRFQETEFGHIGEPEFYRHVAGPLALQIATDFPDQQIRLRGIKTSINGAIYIDDEMTVLDIEDVVHAGEERLAGTFNVGGFARQEKEHAIHHRVSQYAAYTDLFKRDVEDGSGRSESVFPAVLVYDQEQLQAIGSYGTTIKDPAHADKAILAAYILDCPAR